MKWASQLSSVVRRYLYRRLVEDDYIRIRKSTKDNNWFNTRLPPPVIHGVEIPRTVDEAYKFDKLNNDKLWTDVGGGGRWEPHAWGADCHVQNPRSPPHGGVQG